MSFCKLLDDAIQDEEKAKAFYKTLKEALQEAESRHIVTPREVKIVTSTVDSILSSETIHGVLLSDLKKMLCKE